MTAIEQFYEILRSLYASSCETSAAHAKFLDWLHSALATSALDTTIVVGDSNPDDPDARAQYVKTLGELLEASSTTTTSCAGKMKE